MNICVTGGAGFIGSHLVDRLIAEGYCVQVIDNLRSGSMEFVNKNAEFIGMDIRDPKLVDVWQEFKPDYVFHEAAQTVVGDSMDDPSTDCDINLMGLINVLNSCRKVGVKKILMPSSAAVYGNLDTLPLTEEMSGEPSSFYGLTKLTTEGYLRIYEEAFGLPYVCYRYANVYGPRQGRGGEGGVVSIFCEHIIENKELHIFGDGLQTRDFVHVHDVVEANILGLKDDVRGIINVSTEISTSLLDLVKVLEEVWGKTLPVAHKEERLGDIKHSLLSIKKGQEVLGYRPKVSLRDGLEDTLQYFKNVIYSKRI